MNEWRGQSESEDGIAVDAERIRKELSEQVVMSGAFCQDYEAFKNIFRFVERRLRRTHISSYIILLTLTNGCLLYTSQTFGFQYNAGAAPLC